MINFVLYFFEGKGYKKWRPTSTRRWKKIIVRSKNTRLLFVIFFIAFVFVLEDTEEDRRINFYCQKDEKHDNSSQSNLYNRDNCTLTLLLVDKNSKNWRRSWRIFLAAQEKYWQGRVVHSVYRILLL